MEHVSPPHTFGLTLSPVSSFSGFDVAVASVPTTTYVCSTYGMITSCDNFCGPRHPEQHKTRNLIGFQGGEWLILSKLSDSDDTDGVFFVSENKD